MLAVYVRPGCHLCDEAIGMLREIDPEAAAGAEIIDIEEDDELLRKYLELIPVITLDGKEISRLEPEPESIRQALGAGRIR